MEWKNIISDEISQTQKNKYCIFSKWKLKKNWIWTQNDDYYKWGGDNEDWIMGTKPKLDTEISS